MPSTDMTEAAVAFDCEGSTLVGILTQPAVPSRKGVLFLTGGLEYRAGSHRLFVQMSRALAASGIASLRFDYRGLGDSEGDRRPFDDYEADMLAALAYFRRACAVPLEQVDVLGLCDSASAAMLHAPLLDAQVQGLILVNPWVHDFEYSLSVKVAHYYRPLLAERGAWRRILAMEGGPRKAAASLGSDLARYLRRPLGSTSVPEARSLQDCMLAGLSRFQGDVLMVRSEKDLTAQETLSRVSGMPGWSAIVGSRRYRERRFPGADHTFSRSEHRDAFFDSVSQWVSARQ